VGWLALGLVGWLLALRGVLAGQRGWSGVVWLGGVVWFRHVTFLGWGGWMVTFRWWCAGWSPSVCVAGQVYTACRKMVTFPGE
jgi:hypothetical protein